MTSSAIPRLERRPSVGSSASASAFVVAAGSSIAQSLSADLGGLAASPRAMLLPPAVAPPAPRHALCARVRRGFLLRFRSRFLVEERLPVGHGDLIVVGMDFVERKEPVTVAAVVDEGRLERRFDARDFREVDISA